MVIQLLKIISLLKAAETSRHALENAGIDPTRRAETLTVEEFVRLGKILKDQNIIKIHHGTTRSSTEKCKQ